MVWLPDCANIVKICLFVSTESTNVTDGQTPHDGISRACIASRGNKILSQVRRLNYSATVVVVKLAVVNFPPKLDHNNPTGEL